MSPENFEALRHLAIVAAEENCMPSSCELCKKGVRALLDVLEQVEVVRE